MKIVTAEEMARVEKIAYTNGASPRNYMLQAGKGIADAAHDFILIHGLEKEVTLLVGKGNNGGDACVAGSVLLEKGYNVTAITLYTFEESSPLCQEMLTHFKNKGGAVAAFPSLFPRQGVILDGIVGTGFRGKAEGLMLEAIHAAHATQLPILAIDIPSGVNGNTGCVESEAIIAEETIYLGFPKLGFFLNQGWDHVGELKGVDFGLDPQAVADIKAEAELFYPDLNASLLPPIKRTGHKYQRGYLLGIAGSENMPGAALLSSLASLRAGAGMVRLFHLCSALTAPYEVIHEYADKERIFEEIKRARALFIGPGLGREREAFKLIKLLLKQSTLPCVIDADALYFLAKHPSSIIRGPAILTPHAQEMRRLLQGIEPTPSHCQAFVEKHQVTVVLKGAPTIIFHPGKKPLMIARGDPGMATAGSGDVLTGIIGAFLAQGLTSYQSAISGVFFHALAGESAAVAHTSHSMIASDIIAHLSDAFLLFQ
ncbi:MAG: NAD(P)H-hydrate dehydratase [Chlamydiota bacterium]